MSDIPKEPISQAPRRRGPAKPPGPRKELQEKIREIIKQKKTPQERINNYEILKMHMGKKKENMIPPRPGDKYNPWGVLGKKGAELRALREYFYDILAYPAIVQMPGGEEELKTVMDQIVLRLTAKALEGDLKAMEMVLDRNFGKEEQRVAIRASHEAALQLLKREADTQDEAEDVIEVEGKEGEISG